MLKIAVVGGKGGTTKTATARAIAVKLAQRGFTVAGYDTDGEQASFVRWNERRKANGHAPTFPVIQAESISRMMANLDKFNYQASVIDGGAYVSRDTAEIAKGVDLLVLPTTDSIDDMESLVRIIGKLRERGIPAMRIAVTFSGVLESEQSLRDAEDYLASQDIYVVPGYIPRKTSFKNALDAGLSLVEVRNAPRLFTMARTVFDGIIDRAIFAKEICT